MIYLDTHVVIWLYGGRLNYFSEASKELLRKHDLFISPIVRLELQYLFALERVDADANTIMMDLQQRIGLLVCQKPFNEVISTALPLSWTRDPFDRIITAHASLNENILLTRDEKIHKNYAHASW